ncbi:hypothetical protein DVS28_a2900 [Euzebya pacifica]|uniref:Methylamine utilization protein MauE n=1 Tax=Euzebya pacifica TaxID=1608957 RepID=A0A346XZD2_9ACTN|nr:hypothetical protein [Euzebya pacifica]AXV07579.1 hypothetical protein DVS28_a2900 [Euzebya pacifica]
MLSVIAGAVTVLLLISAWTSSPVLPIDDHVRHRRAALAIRSLEATLALVLAAALHLGSTDLLRLASGAVGLLFVGYTAHQLKGARAGSMQSCGCTPFEEIPSFRTALRAASVVGMAAALSTMPPTAAPSSLEWLMALVFGTALLFWPTGFGMADQVVRRLEVEHRWDVASRG